MYAVKKGFSLIEILIATLIIGILTSIAIPSYRSYIDNTNNRKAISDIYAIQMCLERFYSNNFIYPMVLSDISGCLPNNGLDPWGNTYIYLNIVDGGKGIKGDVRKDKKLNPINSLYDLYSMGKDGKTKKQLDNKDSVDDIILARDGGFVGVSADF